MADRLVGRARRGLTAIGELAAMVDAAAESSSDIELRERMAEIELGLEDMGWYRVGYENQAQLSRSGLRRLTTICRMLYLKHPLINHAVDIATHYVWGQGISVVAKSDEINAVVQAWWDLKDNRREITGHRARMAKERELRLAGNVFLVLFTDPIRGTVRVSSIDPGEIEELVTNPQNRREPWFYRRRYYTAESFDLDEGVERGQQAVDEYYPDWQYQPPARPARIAGRPVNWDSPIYHVKVGGLDNMQFGVPEIFPAIDWARAVQTDLENYATVRKALARFAWMVTVKGTPGGFAAAKKALETTIGVLSSTGESNPPPVAGSTLLQKRDAADMQPIKTAGMQPSPDEGRRLGLMAGAGLGIPETMLWGDATLGNYATAKSLDRPTELSFATRQQDWSDTFGDLIGYALDAAARATRGPLKPKYVIDAYSGEQSVQIISKLPASRGSVLDRRVDVAFPDILERDMKDTTQAIATAATLNGFAKAGLIDDKTLARLLLVALKVNNVDEILSRTHPDEPNAPPAAPSPTPAPPAVAPPAPSDAPAQESAETELALERIRESVAGVQAVLQRELEQRQQVDVGGLVTLVLREASVLQRDNLAPVLEQLQSTTTVLAELAGKPPAPVQLTAEVRLPAARRVKRTKEFKQDERGHVTGSTETEEEAD